MLFDLIASSKESPQYASLKGTPSSWRVGMVVVSKAYTHTYTQKYVAGPEVSL